MWRESGALRVWRQTNEIVCFWNRTWRFGESHVGRARLWKLWVRKTKSHWLDRPLATRKSQLTYIGTSLDWMTLLPRHLACSSCAKSKTHAKVLQLYCTKIYMQVALFFIFKERLRKLLFQSWKFFYFKIILLDTSQHKSLFFNTLKLPFNSQFKWNRI